MIKQKDSGNLDYPFTKGGKAMAYESLFKPIKIGAVEFKNRIGLAPQNLNCMWLAKVGQSRPLS